MKHYCITYDLNKSDKNYEGLYSAIKTFNNIHVMDSVWFVKTNLNANEIYDKLKSEIDNNDNLFICDITFDYSGWLSKSIWNWLKS